jgi:hypothetical protein
MNEKFDELTKGLAQSVTRRGALKKFGVGIAGVVLGAFFPTNNAKAGTLERCLSHCRNECSKQYPRGTIGWQLCFDSCAGGCPLPVG